MDAKGAPHHPSQLSHLHQLNVARLRHPLDHPASSEFVAVLDAVNAIAEASPGFVWRLRDDAGRSSSYVSAHDDPQLIVNLTTWTDVDSLRHFTYRSGHGAYLRRRREWFERPASAHLVCWWAPAGASPELGDALGRLAALREHGPGPSGFTLADPFPPPG